MPQIERYIDLVKTAGGLCALPERHFERRETRVTERTVGGTLG